MGPPDSKHNRKEGKLDNQQIGAKTMQGRSSTVSMTGAKGGSTDSVIRVYVRMVGTKGLQMASVLINIKQLEYRESIVIRKLFW